MKRLLLSIIIGTILISGCNQSTPQNNEQQAVSGDAGGLKLPLDTSNTTIRWITLSSINDLNQKSVIQKLREVTGVNVQVEAIPASTGREKIKVLIASKNIPDIIGDGVGSIQDINDLAVQGAFASVSDSLSKMPNFNKLFGKDSEYNWIFKSYGADDGKLYAMPHFDTQRKVNHGMLYRKDIFDKHGITMWNSPEEFKGVLQKLKSLYPDSTPFTSKNLDGIFGSLATSWGIKAFSPYYNEEEKIWKYGDTDPAMKEMLSYLRSLYSERLIDPEFLTLTQAAWTAKMTQKDKAFTTFDWIGRLDMFKEQTAETIPEYDLRYANPIGPKGTLVTLTKVLPLFAVVANGKNSALAFKLMDFMYSPMGTELLTLGVENETYKKDETGKITYPEFPADKKIGINDLEEKYGMFVQGTYKRIDKRSVYFQYSERELEAQQFDDSRFEPEDPVLAFTKEETAMISSKQNVLITAAKEMFTNYILSNQSEEVAWSEWIKKAKKLGEDELIKVYNQAQQRFEGAKE